MKKNIFMAVLSLMAMSAAAQDTYESAKIATKDLNGTARYVGMGGAMEALGADISTIGTNPAGIGLLRKSQAAVTLGLQNVSGSELNYMDCSKSTFGLDQAGVVLVTKMGNSSFLNFGFSYGKSRNFNQLMAVEDALDGASQNKLAFDKYHCGAMKELNYSQLDDLYNYVLNGVVGNDGKLKENFYEYFDASRYQSEQRTEGYIADYDFNISGNINNKVYLGLTLGLKDVHYRNSTVYKETLLDLGHEVGEIKLLDDHEVKGTGVDMKLGAIVRPIETSPFRVGAYIHTPTWYKLKTTNYTTLHNNMPDKYGNYDSKTNSAALEYRVNTPWVFGLSMGHTIENAVALGVTYEYSDYKNLDNRVIDNDYYDYYYDGYFESSHSDHAMKRNTRDAMKGVHTLKVGMEAKVSPHFSVRAGYNYVSPKYNVNGYRDQSIESQGTYFASTTDYTNWKATNRVTFGLGMNKGSFYADLAYCYSQTDGEYCPFMGYDEGASEYTCVPDIANVSDKRHKVQLTMGFRF